MAEPEDFLTRWSRRKREAKVESTDPAKREAAAAPTESNSAELSAPPETSGAKPEVFDLSKLPSLDSIGPATDIRVFLQAGVPEALSRAALRRAWSADPGIRDFIGLSENSWDFTATDGMHGFGALDPAEAKRVLAKLMSGPENDREAPSDDFQSAESPIDAELAIVGNPEACSGPTDAIIASASDASTGVTDELLQANNSTERFAAAQKEEAGTLPEPAPRRSSHGRALPQ